MSSLTKLLSTKQAAAILDMHAETLYKLKHDVGFVRIGRRVKFTEEAIAEYVRNHSSH
jgi:excisionase family DNA binding protein